MEQPILTVVTLAEEVEEEAPVETATAEWEASAAPTPEAK
jgi:hypothetical protein